MENKAIGTKCVRCSGKISTHTIVFVGEKPICYKCLTLGELLLNDITKNERRED